MTEAWQLWLLWGLAVGVGTGALALVFGAIVANRWFVKHRGVVMGVFSAAGASGHLLFLPAIAWLADGPGWRYASGDRHGFALLLVPLVLLLMRDRPTDVGTTPYGAPDDWEPPPPAPHDVGGRDRCGPHAEGERRGRARSGSCSARSGSAAGRPTG